MEILKFLIYVLSNYSVARTCLLYLVWLLLCSGVVLVSSLSWKYPVRFITIAIRTYKYSRCLTWVCLVEHVRLRTWENARQARLQKLQSKGKPAVERINTRHFPVSSVTRNKGLGRQPSVSPLTAVTSEFPPLASPRGRSGVWSQSFGPKS